MIFITDKESVRIGARGDYYFPRYNVYFVPQKRVSCGIWLGLPKKIIYPGFYFRTRDNGLTGPHPNILETLSQRKDYYENH